MEKVSSQKPWSPPIGKGVNQEPGHGQVRDRAEETQGINVQFFCEESEKLVVKTIALMDSNAKHDAESIKKLLLVALKRL